MKVKILKTGGIIDVNDTYGARLIEQGEAVLAKFQPAPKKAEETAAKAKQG